MSADRGGEASARVSAAWGERTDEARMDRWIALAIASATIVVFASALANGFLSYDDPGYVTKNPVVMQGLTLRGIAWAFTTTAESNYWEPLAWISHMLDVSLFGMSPGGHHATSVVLHTVSAVWLFLALRRLTGARGRSAVVAALFALHPLHVESVAWIAERKDLLAGLFWAAALWAYAGYVRHPGVGRYLAVPGFFALGLMSKPMVVTLPAVLLLLDVWPLERVRFAGAPRAREGWRWVLVEKLPLAALSAACAAIAILAPPSGAVVPLAVLGWGPRVANAALSTLFYLWKTIAPAGLAVFYPYDESPAWGGALAAAAILGAITIAVLVQHRRRPWLLTGWGWYLVTLLPVIGLVQVGSQARADRYAYLPLIGVFLAGVWLVAEAAERFAVPRAARLAAGLGVPALCGVLSVVQLQHWRSSTTLFTHALKVTTGNFVAHTSLGTELGAQGRLEESSEQYRAALAAFPAYYLAHFNLGQNLVKEGRLAEALVEFEAALQAMPDYTPARISLAYVLNRLNRPAEAAAQCERALQSDPRSVLLLNNLAWIRATSVDDRVRNGEEAVRRASEAVALDGGRNMRYIATLAAAYAEAGRFSEAVATVDRAAAIAHASGIPAAEREYAQQRALYAAEQPMRVAPADKP